MKTLVLALALVACGKGKDAADTKGSGGGGPAKVSATEVFDYLSAGGTHLTAKYPDGVTLTTTVQGNGDRLMLKVDDRMVSAAVALDDPAKGAALKKGDPITVTCKDGTGSGSLIKLTGCSL